MARRKELRFKTFIIPSKESIRRHQESIKNTIKKHKNSAQAELIIKLNPIIRGWCNYFQFSDAQTAHILSNQDNLVYQKLRAWGRYRCGNLNKAHSKYFTKIGKRNWIFATREGDANPLRLLFHSDFGSSSTEYVKVKGKESPYNGKLVYWSTRMGRSPEMPNSKAIKLKIQKGKCNWCGLHFREGDILEEDHIIATALGGKNEYRNLQLLHGHCHDEKTAIDLIEIRKIKTSKFVEKISRKFSKLNYKWIDDIPVIINC